MGEIKAIETVYNGYRFRSRLEARWAVFFDAMGIRYEYEPEGFKLENGECYLPDFYLPEMRIYVEVKPASQIFIEFPEDDKVTFGDKKTEKYGFFARGIAEKGFGAWFVFGDPVDALFINNHGGKGDNKLFYMGVCIPKAIQSDTCFCRNEERRVSECDMGSRFCCTNIVAFCNDFAVTAEKHDITSVEVKILPFGFMEKVMDEDEALKKDFLNNADRTIEACTKARQAQFEHGKTPTGRRY